MEVVDEGNGSSVVTEQQNPIMQAHVEPEVGTPNRDLQKPMEHDLAADGAQLLVGAIAALTARWQREPPTQLDAVSNALTAIQVVANRLAGVQADQG
mmetsp:Transcript_119007/g.237245  ORF Transcript_119007/g.237245 Transcript_119007/m.237245 type:complete len:97 (+) Transcript_119007:396-686(+)